MKKHEFKNTFPLTVFVFAFPLMAQGPRAHVNTVMAEPRGGACVVALPDGRFLITGGRGDTGALASSEFLNGAEIAPMNYAHSDHVCAVLPNGNVLVAGGHTAGGGITNAAEIYDVAANQWASAGPMMSARAHASASVLKSGKVVVAGGEVSGGPSNTVPSNSIEIFDPATSRFSAAGTLSTPRVGHGAAALNDERVLIAGGSDGSNALDSIEIFNPETQSVTQAGHLSTKRAGVAVSLLLDGRVLIAGGNDGDRDLASIEIFNPKTGTVKTAPDMSYARRDGQAVRLPDNNSILIVGGTSSGEFLAATEVFVPWQNRFKPGTSLQLGRSAVAIGAAKGRFVAVGGRTAKGVTALAEGDTYPTVNSDKTDYQPGNTVTLAGTNWQPGETVSILLHVDPQTHADVTLTAAADAGGSFTNSQYVVQRSDLGVTFTVTATGNMGSTAQILTFTDAGPDLTIGKTNDVGGATNYPTGWTWTLQVSNSGTTQAVFNDGDVILHDDLPRPGVNYTLGSVGSVNHISNPGNIVCSLGIGANNATWSCKASGATVTIGAGGSFQVTVSATPTQMGTFSNPKSGGTCAVDPGNVVSESNETNNSCSDTVIVHGPDLVAVKSNNLSGGKTAFPNGWTWTITVENSGTLPATFKPGQVVLQDDLPQGVQYGSPSIVNITGLTNPAILTCGLVNVTLTCNVIPNASGNVTIGAGGSFRVSLTATPNAPGTFANPGSGGICMADPNGLITEEDETNNTCSNSVVVTGPDLTVTKTNNVSGSTNYPAGWTWTVKVLNLSATAASFPSGAVIVQDDLPPGITYTAQAPGNFTNVTGSANIQCTLDTTANGSTIVCKANGGTVTIGAATGSFTIPVLAAPNAAGSYANPRSGGVCAVDPNNDVTEDNEANNSCKDTVVVRSADLTAVKTDTVHGSTPYPNGWTWSIKVANNGSLAATFASGQTILRDDLPSGLSLVTPSVTSVANITNSANMLCTIDSGPSLLCRAQNGSVTIGTLGTFTVSFAAAPSMANVYVNPRAGGTCAVDPDNVVVESNKSNNSCSDPVTASAPTDLSVTLSNDVGGSLPLNLGSRSFHGSGWTWTVNVSNPGAFAAFPAGQVILRADLPSGAFYGPVTVSNVTNVTNLGNMLCGVASQTLFCIASGATVSIGYGGFSLAFTATPFPPTGGATTFATPVSGGVCAVDPNNFIAESNKANNSCSDSVSATGEPLHLTPNTGLRGDQFQVSTPDIAAPSEPFATVYMYWDGTSIGSCQTNQDSPSLPGSNPCGFHVPMTGANGSPTTLGAHTVLASYFTTEEEVTAFIVGYQTINITTGAPVSAAKNSNFQVAATASSGLDVSITTAGPCSGSGTGSATITMTSNTGACLVFYTQAGNSDYLQVQAFQSVNATKFNQTITVTTSAPSSAAYNSSFNVAATASSALPVAITSSGSCSGNGTGSASITMTSGTGTCTVKYNQAGNTNYQAAPEADQTTAAVKLSQTITVTAHAPSTETYNTQFVVTATASSGFNVAIKSSNDCSGSGSDSATIKMTSGTGACTVTYSQAGNTNYSAAAPVSESTTAAKLSQMITVTTHAPASAAYNTSFTVTATASSGLFVTIAPGPYDCSGGGLRNSGTITMTNGSGTCEVTYTQPGDFNYLAAPEVDEFTNDTKANQTITVTTPAPASAVYNSSFTVAATASSALAVAIAATGACSGSGFTSASISMTSGTGTCTITFTQAGDGNNHAAAPVTETPGVTKANQQITVSTHAPLTALVAGNFNVAASASSGLPVAIAGSGACSGGGSVSVNIPVGNTAGDCVVTYSQPGNNNYNAAATLTDNTVVSASLANLSATITSKTGPLNERTWIFTIHNNGPQTSVNTAITGITLTQTFGAACGVDTSIMGLGSGAFPVSPGTIAPNGNATVEFILSFSTLARCPANARFTVAAQLLNNGVLAGIVKLTNQTQ